MGPQGRTRVVPVGLLSVVLVATGLVAMGMVTTGGWRGLGRPGLGGQVVMGQVTPGGHGREKRVPRLVATGPVPPILVALPVRLSLGGGGGGWPPVAPIPRNAPAEPPRSLCRRWTGTAMGW